MANIIKVTDNRLRKQGNIIFGNSSTLSFIIRPEATNFPSMPNSSSYFVMDFDSSQTIRINYGDGQIINYNTFVNVNGVHRFRFGSAANVGEVGAIAPRNFINSNTRRNVYITFDKERLINFSVYQIGWLSLQTLIFPFNEYPNLKTLSLELLANSGSGTEAITSLDFRNIENSKIDFLALRRVFSASSEYLEKIDSRIFQLPLKVLTISGNYQNYLTSNAPMIGTELADTLENLGFSVPITQASGFPASFTNLTNLKNFNMVSIITAFNLTTFPSLVNNWTNLVSFTFANNTGNGLMTSFGCNFINFPELTNFNMGGNITNITNFSFISQFQNKIKTLTLIAISNATKMTTVINEIYNLVISKASITGANTLPYRGIRLSLENYVGWTAAVIPTGTYQAPTGYVQGISNGSPASDKERLYVLAIQYGFTITYRAS